MEMLSHVTVVTSCTGMKVPAHRPVPAEDLYRGQQHLRLMRGVRQLREAGTVVDVWIVSAGHGVVRGGDRIRAYDQTFAGRPASERHADARRLRIPDRLREVLARRTDLGVVLLGENYLAACALDAEIATGGPALLFCSTSAALGLPSMRNVRIVALRSEDTRAFSCGFVGLKGEVGGRLLAHLANGQTEDDIVGDVDLLSTLADAGPVLEGPAVAASTLF